MSLLRSSIPSIFLLLARTFILLCLCLSTQALVLEHSSDSVPHVGSSPARAPRLRARGTLVPPAVPYLRQKIVPFLEEQWNQKFGSAASQEIPVWPVVENALYSRAPTRYKMPITVGDQSFDVQVDTGSDTTAPPNAVPGRPRLDISRPASTFRPDGGEFRVAYNTIMQRVNGITGKAIVGLKGIQVQHTIGVARNVGMSFGNNPAVEGVIGLGPPSSSSGGLHITQTIFSTMPRKLFTVSLRDNHYSHVRFGAIDPSKFSGDLVYRPIIQDPNSYAIQTFDQQWAITAAGISITGGAVIGGTKGKLFDARKWGAWFDTGAPYIHLPQPVFDEYLARTPNSAFPEGSLPTAPCDAPLPSINIHLLVGKGNAAIRKAVSIPGQAILGDRTTATGDDCFLRLLPADIERTVLLGLPFFNSQFVVFDWNNRRIGMAPHA
ncbi:MAG: hypothetical protein M1816_007474 [Peltula sp. TS41687]|nr:MAG: hypothetical protein M1816_007474 [Peltula sp. TS41687]